MRAEGQAEPSREALEAFDLVLNRLVADSGPTPQVGATPSGSVEIQWLVDGTLVSALFDESGMCYMLVTDDRDDVLIEEDVPAGRLSGELKEALGGMLASMGQKVVARPAVWGPSAEW